MLLVIKTVPFKEINTFIQQGRIHQIDQRW